MDRRTFCIETHTNSNVSAKELLVTECVETKRGSKIYHTIKDSNNKIRSLRIEDGSAFILKEDEVIECQIQNQVAWKSPYEVILCCLKFASSGFNILCYGWHNEIIEFTDKSSVRVKIKETPVWVEFETDEDGWSADIIGSDYDHASIYSRDKTITNMFSSNSDVVRIGFNNREPTSLETEII